MNTLPHNQAAVKTFAVRMEQAIAREFLNKITLPRSATTVKAFKKNILSVYNQALERFNGNRTMASYAVEWFCESRLQGDK